MVAFVGGGVRVKLLTWVLRQLLPLFHPSSCAKKVQKLTDAQVLFGVLECVGGVGVARTAYSIVDC